MAKDAFETQQMVRQNTAEVTQISKDLRNWQKEMKEKEKMAKNESLLSNGDLQQAEVRISDLGEKRAWTAIPRIEFECSSVSAEFFALFSIRGLGFQKNMKIDLGISLFFQAQSAATPLRSDREKFGEYESRVKRSKTEDTDLNKADAKEKAALLRAKGKEYVQKLDFTNAIQVYKEAIDWYSSDSLSYSNLGLCYLREKRFTESIEASTKAMSLDPKLAKPYYRRSKAREALDETAGAIEDMKIVIQLEPQIHSHKKELEQLMQKLSTQSFERKYILFAKLPQGMELQIYSFVQKLNKVPGPQ